MYVGYRLSLSSSFFFFSSRRRHTRLQGDWSSDVCSSDLIPDAAADGDYEPPRRRARHYLDLEEGEGLARLGAPSPERHPRVDRKSTRLNSSHLVISYAVFCLKKKKKKHMKG